MGNAIQQIRANVSDMLSASRQMLASVATQLHSPEIEHLPHARWLLEHLRRTLDAHVRELDEHLRRLGGGSAVVRSFPAHGDVLDSTLREYYAGLSLAHAGALMLEANARALGFSSTAALAGRHREEIATMLVHVREALAPAA